jgi:hypothetical protein
MSFFRRIAAAAREAIAAVGAGARLTGGAIARRVRVETAAQAPVAGAPQMDRETFLGRLLWPRASSFSGTWVLPKVISQSARALTEGVHALERGYHAYVLASVAAARYLTDPLHAPLAAEYARVTVATRDIDTTRRTFRLPLGVYLTVIVAVAVADFAFFAGILYSLQDTSPNDPDFVAKVVMAVAFAATTPLLVIALAEGGGGRFARLRAELQARRDQNAAALAAGKPEPRLTAREWRALLVEPILAGAAILATVVIFFQFGLHRFGSLTGALGAVDADPVLLAFFTILLPLLAVLAAVLRHDLDDLHRRRILRERAAVEQQLTSNASEVARALETWRRTWLELRGRVGGIIADGQIGVQSWESFVARGIARASELGEVSFDWRASTAGAAATTAPAIAAPTSAATSTEPDVASTVVPGPEFDPTVSVVPIAARFDRAEWVTAGLDATLAALVRYVPDVDGRAADDIRRLLRSLVPTPAAAEPAAADEAAPADADAAPGHAVVGDPEAVPDLTTEELDVLFGREGRAL